MNSYLIRKNLLNKKKINIYTPFGLISLFDRHIY